MMLDHLGHPDASGHVMRAVEASLAEPGTRTRDLGGTASTEDAGAAIVRLMADT
jgi:tartrate dehydrogenase/decarboxylase/D-malate dehydrogenase